jgi:hypothetical protein
MNRRALRMGLLGLMFLLVLVYIRLWALVSSSVVSSSSSSPPTKKKTVVFNTPPLLSASNQQSNIMMIGETKIVAFCNFNYRSVGVTWYKRMTRLGYESHVIVATDLQMVQFLQTRTDFRYEVMVHEPMPDSYRSKPMPKQDHAVLELLMAVRWKFLLQQLEQGVHVLLTDIDNIFTRYIDIDTVIANHHNDHHDHQDPSMDVDVWHAYATKYPRKSFAQQGFVVCSGMSWWRASPAAIRFGRLMHETCGSLCDDQRVLNNLLAGPKLNMTWDWTPTIQASRLTNATTQDPRFVGLPTIGISGRSSITGHTAEVWDREFAFRGPLQPDPCPNNNINWVSMPVLETKSRGKQWMAKLESFQIWDQHCGSELTTKT